jgi:hypothetical protein
MHDDAPGIKDRFATRFLKRNGIHESARNEYQA